MNFSEFGSWETFTSFVNRAGWAWKNLLGQDKELVLRGGQIVFPATSKLSANVNTLDDYEEGTWTPKLTFNGGTTGITYTTQVGYYRKIGSLVLLWYWIVLSSKGSSTGTAFIEDLPFNAASNGGMTSPVLFFNMTSSFTSMVHSQDVSPLRFVFYGLTAAAVSYAVVTDADFADTSNVRTAFSYFTSE